MTTECKCGKPTRDAAFFCDNCGDNLNRALGDVPWLAEELETTITGQRGVDYRAAGGGKGSRTAPRGDRRISGDTTPDSPKADAPALGAHIQNDPANMAAAETRAHLRAILVSWVKFCHDEHVRHQSPLDGLPADNLPAMSRWLMWRVDGLALHDIGPDAVDEIVAAVRKCHRVIDCPADKKFLGRCQDCDDNGSLWVRPGAEYAACDVCHARSNAEVLRAALLATLDDRLCTPREIGDLSTYLNLKATREQVRKHVEYLARKGRIAKHPAISDESVYRFGEVYLHLIEKDYGKKAS